jgi:hypothetical protein
VVAGVGAALGAGGAFVVDRFAARTTKGCASVGISVNGKGGTSFVPHCLEPGMAMVGGLVLAIGGTVVLLVGLFAMVRSWRQRERHRGPDILPPLVPTGPAEHATGASGTATYSGALPAIGPPPGWYAVPPDYTPMWWDGRAWATAPTLPPIPETADDRA